MAREDGELVVGVFLLDLNVPQLPASVGEGCGVFLYGGEGVAGLFSELG